MAKKDYLPKDQDDRDTWLEKWLNKIAAVLLALGLPGTDADAVKTKVLAQRTAFTDWKAEKAAAANKSNIYQADDKVMEAVLRPYNQHLKTTAGYSPAIGNLIGIEGPDHVFDTATAKPDVKLSYEGGQVIVKFNHPHEVSMVEIDCKRGTSATFDFVANDTNSPYHDARPNLDITKPEKREYQLWFIVKGARVGVVSDTIPITVP